MGVIMPNFVPIAQTVPEIWSFFDFERWRPSAILDFLTIEISTADTVRRTCLRGRMVKALDRHVQ